MKEFEEAKRAYEAAPIPAELSARIEAGMQEGQWAYQKTRRKRRTRWITAAACFMALMVGLNLSPTLAHAAAEVPVLGGLFRVLTVIRFDASDGGVNYEVSVPRLEADGEQAAEVNAAIQEKVSQHLEKARQDWTEYEEAFFATGGTEEEWADREMDVFIDYEIKRQTDDQISFVVTLSEGWVAFYEERYYYNLDLAEDRAVTLKDLLGADWVEICNQSIRAQIEDSKDAEGFTYFFPSEEGGFTSVDESTSFYVREDGTVVIAFPRYSIAAGAAGFPEFPIQQEAK